MLLVTAFHTLFTCRHRSVVGWGWTFNTTFITNKSNKVDGTVTKLRKAGFSKDWQNTSVSSICKSISKDWISKTCLFLCQLYYFIRTGVYSDAQGWTVSARRFRTHPVHALWPRLQVPAWHSTKSDESMPTCFCNRGTVACVQRLEDSLLYQIQRRQRMGEELSRSLVQQHETHCPTTSNTAAWLLSCFNVN